MRLRIAGGAFDRVTGLKKKKSQPKIRVEGCVAKKTLRGAERRGTMKVDEVVCSLEPDLLAGAMR